jgi:hypothetical protein
MIALIVIQIFVSIGVVGGAWKANMAAAGLAFPILLGAGAVALFYMDKKGINPTFNPTFDIGMQ